MRRLRVRRHDIATPFLAPDAAVGELFAWVAAGRTDNTRPTPLEGWRGTQLGAELLELLEGRISMTADLTTPLGVSLTPRAPSAD